jgi:VanZ family protein
MTLLSHICKALTFLAVLVVLIMSLRPTVAVGGIPHMDKVLHFAAYAGLAALGRLGWPRLWGGWIFISFATLGIGIEIAQHLMDLGRTGSFADIVANLVGAAVPLIFFHLFWTRHHS